MNEIHERLFSTLRAIDPTRCVSFSERERDVPERDRPERNRTELEWRRAGTRSSFRSRFHPRFRPRSPPRVRRFPAQEIVPRYQPPRRPYVATGSRGMSFPSGARARPRLYSRMTCPAAAPPPTRLLPLSSRNHHRPFARAVASKLAHLGRAASYDRNARTRFIPGAGFGAPRKSSQVTHASRSE